MVTTSNSSSDQLAPLNSRLFTSKEEAIACASNRAQNNHFGLTTMQMADAGSGIDLCCNRGSYNGRTENPKPYIIEERELTQIDCPYEAHARHQRRKIYGRLAREKMDILGRASITISHPNILLPIAQIVGLLKQKRKRLWDWIRQGKSSSNHHPTETNSGIMRSMCRKYTHRSSRYCEHRHCKSEGGRKRIDQCGICYWATRYMSTGWRISVWDCRMRTRYGL